ncbi:S9 family peptidase [Spirulina major]|uniref:S9 family peptidase n=1 Tax=Spirulina major TaxID=270636 RepID=UPI000933A96B|nr:S9 family peptidase [Spirulina major]
MNTAPFGTWQSPITSDLIVSSSIGLGGVALDGEALYWVESRPSEGGRTVIVQAQGEQDCTPAPFNVRSRVHEYGGGASLIADGVIYFVNFADQRIYHHAPGAEPQPLTPENQHRYAEMQLDRDRNRLIAVGEDHSQGGHEPKNLLVSVDLTTGTVTPIVTGSDFYASPRLSPDGSRLAWVDWHHPQMPWDGTQLWVAEFDRSGKLGLPRRVAGNKTESICAPLWSPDGVLYFVSDRNNWWNLYRDQNGIELVYEQAAEFGYPHWVFGVQPYRFRNAQSLICTYSQNGQDYLAQLDLTSGTLTPIDLPFTSLGSLQISGDVVYAIAGSPTQPTQLIRLHLPSGDHETLKTASSLTVDPGYLSSPEAIAFPTTDGHTAHAWYYPPQNQDYTAPDGEQPPLLVKSHGGPTAAASATLNLRIQYWTSRGFAYVDVNYGGSTGYGRAYRQRLNGNWGIVDVDDCTNVAVYLAEQGRVDRERLAIAGGSAGGYTTLAALTFKDVFKAGASYYGVSDLEALAQDTHKFEARYLDGLIGKYPEDKAVYEARSPIHHTAQLACPVIFFQGLEDKVVPPNQAELMVNALKTKGLPVAYVPFEGEQHGFRKAENIKRALDGEFYFYSRVFNFTPAESLPPVEIINLPA